MKGQLALVLLGALFVVSGFSALLVEQVFEKLLLTVVGSATGSASIVLAVFFLGLTGGGFLYGALSGRVQRPLVTLLLLELTVAGSGLLLSSQLGLVQAVSARALASAGEQPLLLFLLRVGLSALWMGLPTLAMGATYPALVKVLEHQNLPQRAFVPTLFYGLNLLGAVSAGVLGPYLLFPRWGLLQALTATCFLQTAVALGVAISCVRLLPPPPERSRSSVHTSPRPDLVPGLVALAAFSGFFVFSLEVVWYHLIGSVLGMSAYAFATMLIVVLLALFVGSVLVSLLPRWMAEAPTALSLSLLLTSGALVSSNAAWPATPELLYDHGYAIRDFGQAEWLRFVLAWKLIGPPALMAGTTFPLILRTKSIAPKWRAQAVAFLGVSNALGCAGGALLTGFALIPHLGAEQTLGALASLAGFLALLTVWRPGISGGAPPIPAGARRDVRPANSPPTAPPPSASGAHPTRTFLLTLASLLAIVVPFGAPDWDRLALTSGIHVYLRPSHVARDSKLLFWHEDTQSGFVTVVARTYERRTVRTLLTNGKFQGNDAGEAVAQTAFAALPCLATPGRKAALVIGLGTGQSARVIDDAGFDLVELVEIAPGMVAAARTQFGDLNNNVLDRPEVRLIIEDGRNHLLRTSRKYDVISMEISSIWFAGATSLYSREFYELAREHVREGGVLQQWIQLHHISADEVLTVLKTVRMAFPYVELWYLGQQGIILASDAPIHLTPAEQTASWPTPFRADLRALAENPSNDATLWESRVLSAEAVDRIVQSPAVRVNTDANRWLEFATPRHLFSRMTNAQLLEMLLPYEREPQLALTRSRIGSTALTHKP